MTSSTEPSGDRRVLPSLILGKQSEEKYTSSVMLASRLSNRNEDYCSPTSVVVFSTGDGCLSKSLVKES